MRSDSDDVPFVKIFISLEWIYPVAKQAENNKLTNLTININTAWLRRKHVKLYRAFIGFADWSSRQYDWIEYSARQNHLAPKDFWQHFPNDWEFW